jgi:eukaryotic-like serine/threonine-protein kinase
MQIETGAQLGPYQILSPLGAGGMGEVHLAEDTRLKRKVALKVLPDSLAQDKERLRRFEQEAFAASALNHPNILTIYEFGVEGATHFLATEFIDGETLRARLERARPSLTEALDIAVQTAQALAAAHAAHIIHRDIKPENVMLRKDGIVKVLDFGLAKLVEPAPLDAEAETRKLGLTQAGTVMGTVAYMSPEQARGKTVDARTDIFSLGVMLYEMLARRQPFTGKTVNHVIVAILEQEPPPLAQDVPAELARILKQMLAKPADDRYASAQDLLTDLKRLQMRLLVEVENKRNSSDSEPVEAQTMILPQTTAAAPAVLATAAASAKPTFAGHTKLQKWWLAAGLSLLLAAGGYFGYRYFTTSGGPIDSLAVLPFQNRSGNADSEYLSDGLAETLIYRLSQLPNLKVSPTSSVFRYKGKDTNPLSIAKELGVQAVMTGRIAQRGDTLVISVELVDVRNNKTLWGDQYERKLADLLSIQREMTSEITERLQLKLSGEGAQKLTRKYTDNPEAYQLYLKGRFYWNKRTAGGLKQAVGFYQQAIEKDPNYALAYSGLAETYALFSTHDVASAKDSMPQAKAAALRALALDDSLAEAHAALGWYLNYYEWDRTGAEKALRRAIELNPNYANAYDWLGAESLATRKRFDEALVIQKRAEELDPLSAIISANIGWTLFLARRYDEAIAQNDRALALDPNLFIPHAHLCWAYNAKGMYKEAIAECRKARELNDDYFNKGYLALVLARSGQGEEARKLLNQLKELSARSYVTSYALALAYIGLNEKEEAFFWLEKEVEERGYWTGIYALAPELDDLRPDPRFKAMLKRLNLPE